MPSQAVLAALLTAALATGAFAPIARAHDASPGGGPAGTQDIVAYGMNASAQRFSPLTRINRSNVHRLVPKWALSLNDARGIEGQPVLHDGLLYVTTHDATIAVNALTGKQVWRGRARGSLFDHPAPGG